MKIMMETRYTIKNFVKRALMVLAVVLMAGSVWGGNKTGTLDMSTSQASPVTNNGVTFTWSSTNIVTSGNSGFKSPSTMTITIPSGTTLVSISKTNHANIWGGSASISVYTGSTNSGTNIATIVTGKNSYPISSDNTGTTYFFENNTGGNAWITSLSITYYEASDPHTVNFSVTSGTPASTSLTEASGDAGIVLPNVTPDAAVTAAGWGFYGWAEVAVGTETTTAPTIVGKAGDTYYPAEDVTLHAVYAKGEYTKVTSTSDLNSTDKYFFAAIYSTKNYIMTSDYSSDQLAAKQIDETATGKYHAASIKGEWCYTLEANKTYWHIIDCNPENSDHYLDTYYTQWYGHSKDSGDPYTFTYSTDHWEIENKYSSSSRYFGYSSEDDAFIRYSTAQPLQIYKSVSSPKYASAPCLNVVSLSKGTETNATISSFSETGVQTCSSTAADRQVTITVAAATGYEFLSTARLTFAKTSGTATAEYVSGPTGSGPYTWVYQFSQDDSGAGTFSVTSATPKSYTVTLNNNGASTAGTADVKVTYNSATLPAITNPKKTHYMFQGWYSGSGGTGNLVINKAGELQENVAGYTGDGGVWTKDGTTTLYAKWTEHTYTNYRTKCCDNAELAFTTDVYENQVREDLNGNVGSGNKFELVIPFTTSSTGASYTAEVRKLTGGDKRSESATGTSVTGHTYAVVDAASKTITLQVWSSSPGNDYTGQGTYRIKLTQEADGNYCDGEDYCFVDIVIRDKFVDNVNGNTTINKDGVGSAVSAPSEGDLTDVDECHDKTRRLRGWVKESDLQTIYNGANKETGYLEEATNYDANKSKIVAPGGDVKTSATTWYAIWGEEE